MADYRQAMADYQPGEPLGGYVSGGFVAGTLVEKLAPAIGEPITSQGLVAALHTLRGETLGGPLPGITFLHGADRRQVNLCIVPFGCPGRHVRRPRLRRTVRLRPRLETAAFAALSC